VAVFVLRRIALLVASLFVSSVLIFVVLRLLPGGVAQVEAGVNATPHQIAQNEHRLGLDRPLVVQYLSWMGGVLRGNFGTSALSGASVTGELRTKLQVTVPLIAAGELVAILVAVPLGILAAARRQSRLSTVISALSQLGMALPTLWVGLLLIVVFAIDLQWLPSEGFPASGWGTPLAAIKSLILPAITLGVFEGAILLRFVRSTVLDVLDREYLRAARARGRTRLGALVRHGLRNAAPPVVSILGLQVAALILGAVIVEQVFNLSGVGQMLLNDVNNRDLTSVQGEVLIITAAVLVVMFVGDIVNRFLDPRLRTVQ
jgi:peptide/nickel transport system permease protein